VEELCYVTFFPGRTNGTGLIAHCLLGRLYGLLKGFPLLCPLGLIRGICGTIPQRLFDIAVDSRKERPTKKEREREWTGRAFVLLLDCTFQTILEDSPFG